MFCPKYGCMIPDGAKVCTECGHRIRRCEADALKQEQPAKGEARASMTGYATGKDALLVLTCIVSAMLALSFFLEWLGPAGITGLDVVLDQPDMGRGSLAVCAMPLFVAVLGVFCAGDCPGDTSAASFHAGRTCRLMDRRTSADRGNRSQSR